MSSATTATTCAATLRIRRPPRAQRPSRSGMPSRADVVQAVAASEDGLQGLLRDLVAFRTESQAKEATHFPEEARSCIGYVSEFLVPLGFEIEGWDVGPSATFPAHPLI